MWSRCLGNHRRHQVVRPHTCVANFRTAPRDLQWLGYTRSCTLEVVDARSSPGGWLVVPTKSAARQHSLWPSSRQRCTTVIIHRVRSCITLQICYKGDRILQRIAASRDQEAANERQCELACTSGPAAWRRGRSEARDKRTQRRYSLPIRLSMEMFVVVEL